MEPKDIFQNGYDKEWWEDFRREEVETILQLTGNKNSDYTGGNECDNPFANFDGSEEFGVQPLVGLSVRMADKFQRLKAFCRDGKLSVNDHETPLVIFFVISLVTR